MWIVESGAYKYDRELCFSFSGLKTALLTHVKKLDHAPEGDELRDIAASYQEAVCDALAKRVERALKRFSVKSFVCAGGVSMNAVLRQKLADLAGKTAISCCWLHRRSVPTTPP